MGNEVCKILLPKVDVIFKLLFGDKRNIEILIDFLKSVLDLNEDEYESITLEDTHIKRETVDDKLGIVDVKLTTKSGKIVHIEMQILEQDDFPERVTYYNAKMLVAQLKAGSNYKFQKTISIVISDFEIVENSPKCHHKFQLNDTETGINFTDVIEINTLELGKIPTQDESIAKYDWLRFLKAEREEEFDMLAERNPVIKQAVVELKRLSQTEEAQQLYDARQKAIWDENSRTRTAQNRAAREIAINLINMGLSDEQVHEGTKLSLSEIEKLKAKISLQTTTSA